MRCVLLAALLGASALPALAQVPAPTAQGAGLRITPSFGSSVIYTDNRTLSGTNPRSDVITTISPGLSISSGIRGLQGSIDYRPSYIHFARGTGRSGLSGGLSNALRGAFSSSFLENRVTVTAAADVGSQSISAFDLQGDLPNEFNPNRTERRAFDLGVNWRERLPLDLLAQASVGAATSRSADSELGDADTRRASLSLSRQLGALGLQLGFDRSEVEFQAGRRTITDRTRVTASYLVDTTLRVFASVGTERSDVPSVTTQSFDTYGAGLNWSPTPRTVVGLQGERRYFGNSFALNLSHRFRRSSLTYADARSASDTTAGVGTTFSVYEIFFAQFASIEPDPVLRDLLVRDFLRNAGLDPNQRISGGFLSSAVTLQRTRNLSWGWQGRRLSGVLSAYATRNERADRVVGGNDDLARVGLVRQHGYSGSLSWRLAPDSSLVFSVARQSTPGSGTVAGNGLTVTSLSWAERLSRTAGLSVTARRASASGGLGYTENSLRAALNLSF